MLPMQKLMMLGTYKKEHKEMASFPIKENIYNFLWMFSTERGMDSFAIKGNG